MLICFLVLLLFQRAHFANILDGNVFLINTKERNDKLAVSKFQLDLLGINFTRIDAINISSILNSRPYQGELNVSKIVGINDLKLPSEEFKKSSNHAGCWLSHLKALQQISNEPDDKISLILEDDFIADGNAISLINEKLKLLPQDWDLFYVGHCDTKSKCRRYLSGDVCQANANDIVVCLHAYIVKNKSAAKKLFDAGNMKKPVLADFFFQLAHVDRYLIFPSIFTQRKNINADIGSGGGNFLPLKNNSIENLLQNTNF